MLRTLCRTSKRNPFFTFRGYSQQDDKQLPRELPVQNTNDVKGKRLENNLFGLSMGAPQKHDFNGNIKEWLDHKYSLIVQYNQKYNPDNHIRLGSELAIADFVITHRGRVKFRGSSDWITRKKDGGNDLPQAFDPNYILEAIDLSGIDIYYDGLINLYGCVNIKWLSMRGSKVLDDWGLDRISGEYPLLEYLDISECERISERGLESLYRMLSLKRLIVTNHYNSAAFELTCFLLEDSIPGLTCQINDPKN